ncbi:S8 family serine peptidase [Kineococcus rubinsiae]|uniref:S8 family serine peptidase n=1 Tax=Kineococcus rubinsiae TaxID=2609562 RepID=UPI0014315A38|nr:S8 family serine peptidase [Kineococcus rubinsiae]NIZ91653.1 S8 family serine peptidase [Kineococcus rubinsiae]
MHDDRPSTPPPTAGRARRRLVRGAAFAVGALLCAVPVGGAAAVPAAVPGALPAVGAFSDGRYVVTLASDSMASYDGSLPGLPRLKKSADGGVDVTQEAAKDYRARLLQEQSDVAATAGVQPLQRYTVAVNGFSAALSAAQAQKLAGRPGVLSVVPDTVRHLDTTATPDYLGLTGANGVWAAAGGVAKAGAGVVVGVLDTGLWPEHPSVAGKPLGSAPTANAPYTAYRTASGTIVQRKKDGGTFRGTCETGTGWTAANCSTKVIGARAFGEGFLAANGGVSGLGQYEYLSARDGEGHGTHTATTAAGLEGVPATIDGDAYGKASGMAPAASVAVYKVCWSAAPGGDDGCMTSDILGAVDAAIADGVDVINYSIGGGAATTVNDPVELAFLSAASAGVFVSASAGNSGPGASTLDHASPWLTTVAATTAVPREGTVVLGDGRKFVGTRLVQKPLKSTTLTLASAVAVAGKPAAEVAICQAGSLSAKAKGKVVVCDRGVTDRVAKSAEVARVGGAGMVLVNPTPNSIDSDAHTVPTVHLDTAAGAKVKAYAASAKKPTVAFEVGNTTGTPTPAPQIAGFSSRGPTPASDGDVLKPDIAAPGVGIVAGVAPGPNRGNLFMPLSGTSMSAPHVAGLAALYLGVHPRWSPMAVKSAMMTTARALVNADGSPNRNPFDGGAGFVDPTKMLNPGLVYDSTPTDWIAFLEGSGIQTGTGVEAVDPSDLNQASIAVGSLAGTQTVTRSVTSTTTGLFNATATVPGFDVRVSPSVLVFNAVGETKKFTVSFTRTTAEEDEWSTGALTWRGANLSVRSPVAVKPVAVVAPDQVTGTGTEGSTDVTITSGVDGELPVTTAGLAAGSTADGDLAPGADDQYRVEVGEGTSLARFDVQAADDRSDLDLALYRLAADGTAEQVALSATGSADERIDVLAPEAGTYVVQVSGYATAPGASTAPYALTSYAVTPDTDEGDLTATPNPVPVTAGEPVTVSLSWSGLEEGTRYLGWVSFGDSPTPTVVAVD